MTINKIKEKSIYCEVFACTTICTYVTIFFLINFCFLADVDSYLIMSTRNFSIQFVCIYLWINNHIDCVWTDLSIAAQVNRTRSSWSRIWKGINSGTIYEIQFKTVLTTDLIVTRYITEDHHCKHLNSDSFYLYISFVYNKRNI